VRNLVEKKKEINLREADSDRLVFNDIKIQDEIVERAHQRAPNTVALGTVGLIGGAYLGGPVGALAGAFFGSLVGFLLDEET